MRSFFILTACFVILRGAVFAAEIDPVLRTGLNTWVENGAEAGLRAWYSDRPAVAFETKEKLLSVVADLGTPIDSEVVAVQTISQRVTRYYVAIYFTQGPLWIRIERYANNVTAFYLPLKFSTDPDRILPGYITEFQF